MAHNTANVSISISVFARIVQILFNGKADAFCMYVVLKQLHKYNDFLSFHCNIREFDT